MVHVEAFSWINCLVARFLAEALGARRVVAVDNEQYVEWVRARFGVTLPGAAGFRAVAELLDSRVEYT